LNWPAHWIGIVSVLAQTLAARKIDVHVLDLPKVAVDRMHDVAASLYRLSSLIDQKEVDILHTDGPRNTFYAGLIGRLKRKPVVWQVRAFDRDPYDRLLYHMCSKLILVADSLRSRFSFCTDARKLVTIHNGVDLERFKPPGSESRGSEASAKTPGLTIATVGRVEAQKGLLTLLDACRWLKAADRPFTLRSAGEITDRSYFKRCQEFCWTEGISAHVEFLGPVHPIQGLLTSADVFVLPSAGAEAFPRTVIEAMACGKPVVVTDAGGACEAVVNGHTGFVVPARNPLDLADRLLALFEDKDLRESMGRAGRIKAEKFFGIEKNTEQTLRVYEEALRCP
jgi:glycosyltransferase involved in cell wall biosynthesis